MEDQKQVEIHTADIQNGQDPNDMFAHIDTHEEEKQPEEPV